MEAALAGLLPVLPAEAPAASAADAFLPDTLVRTPVPAAPRAGASSTYVPPKTAPHSGMAPTAAPSRPTASAKPSPPSATSARRPRPQPTVVSYPPDEAPKGRWAVAVGLLSVLAVGWLVFGGRRQEPLREPEVAPAEEPAASEVEPGSEATETATTEGPADETILGEVQQLLAASPVLLDARLEVAVANGIVTLSGEAPSATARDLAASLARTAAGAKRVFSMITIAPSGGAAPVAAATPVPAPAEPAPATSASRPAPPPESSKETEVREMLDRARRQIESGDHDGAARTFEAVLRLDPQNPVAKDALERRRAHPPPPPPR
jgi:hypothetical protein